VLRELASEHEQPRLRELVDFPVTKQPECWRRLCRHRAVAPSAFCWEHTQLEALDNLVSLDRFKERHARLAVALAAVAPGLLGDSDDDLLAVAA
jgi:hypothetical protein